MKYKFKDVKYLVPYFTKKNLMKNQETLEYIENIHTKKLKVFNDLQSFLKKELPKYWICIFGFDNVNCIHILNTKNKKIVQEMVSSGIYEPYKINIYGCAIYIKLKNPIPNYPSVEEIIKNNNNIFKEPINVIKDSMIKTFG